MTSLTIRTVERHHMPESKDQSPVQLVGEEFRRLSATAAWALFHGFREVRSVSVSASSGCPAVLAPLRLLKMRFDLSLFGLVSRDLRPPLRSFNDRSQCLAYAQRLLPGAFSTPPGRSLAS